MATNDEIREQCKRARPFFHPGGVDPASTNLYVTDIVRLLDDSDLVEELRQEIDRLHAIFYDFEELAQFFENRAEQLKAHGSPRGALNEVNAKRIRKILKKVDR